MKRSAKPLRMSSLAPLTSTRLVVACCLLFLPLWLTSCGGQFGERTNPLRWTEDVTLPDGRIVTLKREQHFAAHDLIGKYSFEFQHPDTKQAVRWENEGNWKTVAIYVELGVVYLVVEPKFGGHEEMAGCPSPRQIVYQFKGNAWEQVPLLSSPRKVVESNLIRDPKAARESIISNRRSLDARATLEATKIHGAVQLVDFSRVTEQAFLCKERQKIDLK